MSNEKNSAKELIDQIKRKAPEYLDLLTAESEADFDKAFDALLEKAIISLEKNKKNYAELTEVGLSAVLASVLSCPGLTVTQEAHSNGHVDITIEADHCMPARTKLGEAKIYDGPQYHLDGLEQLLERYTTGREGRGLLIEYVRHQDIASLVEKLRQRMDAELPMVQKGKTKDHTIKWSFISTHEHASGDDLDVAHIGCNLHIA